MRYMFCAMCIAIGAVTVQCGVNYALADGDKGVARSGKTPSRQKKSVELRFAGAESATDAREHYARLYDNRSCEQLTRLAGHCSSTVAIHAVFERYLLVKKKAEKGKDGAGKRKRDVKSRDVGLEFGRFLGFLEGRWGITAPKWWSGAIRVGSIYNDELRMPATKELGLGKLFKDKELDPHSFSVPYEVHLKRSMNLIEIRRGKQTAKLPLRVIKALLITSEQIGSQFDACFGKDRVFLACPLGIGCEHSLVCYDTKKNIRIWKAKVWTGLGQAGTGVFEHFTHMTVHNQKLLVFGAGRGGAYLEIFDTASGRPELRFCDQYGKPSNFGGGFGGGAKGSKTKLPK